MNWPGPGGTIGVSEVLQAPPAGQATHFLAERFGAPIAFVNARFRLSHDRSLLRGYQWALRALGERERVLLVRAEEDRGREAVRALLAEAEPPRALLLASSLVVFDGLAALAEHGRRLGEATGVVAVASEERPWTALLPAPLPILALPAREIGRRAAVLTVPVEFLPGDLLR